MAVYNILPKVNLRDIDVSDTLNANGGVTSREFSSFFRASANINKWAYNKPESYDSIFAMSDYERKMNNHGFDVTSITGNVDYLFKNAKNSWTYILPKGGEHSPFRIGDFRGYNPNAKPPFNYGYIMKSGETQTGSTTEVWRVVVNSDAEIKMSNMVVFEDMNASHYMFVARKVSSGEYIISTKASMSGDPSEIVCSITFPSEGEWKCLFCAGQNTDTPIESRTDLVIMPDGYFTYTLVKKVAFVTISYISPSLSDVYYNSMDYSLNIGSIITLKLKASDQTASVPLTVFRFGMIMELYDEYSLIESRSVYSTDSNDETDYSGTDEKYWTVVNFPSPLYLKNYFDQDQINRATKVKLTIDVQKVSGNGSISMDNVFYEYNLR